MRQALKFLIVDDEKDTCMFIKNIFERKGFQVYEALTGEKAVTLAEKLKPDVVLLDIYMPKGMDGMQALREVKKVSPESKCIMVTWDDSRDKIDEAKENGASGYLAKPIYIENLVKEVDKMLKESKKARG